MLYLVKCTHFHLAHNVEELPGRHRREGLANVVDSARARRQCDPRRQRPRVERCPSSTWTHRSWSSGRSSWSRRAALGRRRVVRVGKVEPETATANVDALEVPECGSGSLRVLVLAEAEPLRLACGVVEHEPARAR